MLENENFDSIEKAKAAYKWACFKKCILFTVAFSMLGMVCGTTNSLLLLNFSIICLSILLLAHNYYPKRSCVEEYETAHILVSVRTQIGVLLAFILITIAFVPAN